MFFLLKLTPIETPTEKGKRQKIIVELLPLNLLSFTFRTCKGLIYYTYKKEYLTTIFLISHQNHML